MNLDRLRAYASHHDDITVGRGRQNRDDLRDLIARAHLGGRPYKAPEDAAPLDFRAHRYFQRQADAYKGLGKFEPAQVLSTITTDDLGVTSMSGGNNLIDAAQR